MKPIRVLLISLCLFACLDNADAQAQAYYFANPTLVSGIQVNGLNRIASGMYVAVLKTTEGIFRQKEVK